MQSNFDPEIRKISNALKHCQFFVYEYPECNYLYKGAIQIFLKKEKNDPQKTDYTWSADKLNQSCLKS